MKKNFLHTPLYVLICSSMVASVTAEEIEKTNEVKVTAARVEQQLKDVNMSVSVVTEDEIKHSNAKSVGEMLEDIPGVRINNDGGQGIKRIEIRGESTFRTVVMIDGQRIAEHKSMSGSPIMISPTDIERIEVIKGPASVFYGSDALGGVVNIITKKGGNKPFEADVMFGYNGSSQGTSGAVGFRGGVNGWKYRLSGGYEHNNALRTPKGHAPNSYFDTKNLGGALSYDIDKNWTVGGSLDYYRFKFGSGDFAQGDDFAVDVPKWERTKVGLYGEGKNITSYLTKLRADAFYQKNKKDMVNTIKVSHPRMGTMTQKPYAYNDLDQYGFSLQADWQLGDSNLLLTGYEFNYDKLNADSITERITSGMFGLILPSGVTKSSNYDGYQMNNAVFASMETTLPADFTLNYGIRYTWVKSHMKIKNKLDNSKSEPGNTSDGKAVFNAGITWTGIDDLTLRANFSQGYKFPILQHLYIDTVMGSGSNTTFSNPDLKPETSDNYEIGARWERNGFKFDSAFFLNSAKNYIGTFWNANLNGYQYQNVAKALTFGWEFETSWKIGNTGFEPYAFFTWMRRELKQDGMKTFDAGIPELFSRYGVKWTGNVKSVRLRTDLYGRSQTAIKYKSFNNPEDDYRLGGSTTWNFTTGVDFGPQKQYSLDMGIYNIFNKAWRTENSIYEPGRYFAAKVNASF